MSVWMFPPAAGTPVRVARYFWMSVTKSKRSMAASATVLACGPTVSCVWLIGTTPALLTSPTVGFIPTTPLLLAGQTMLPSVSVPIETLVRLPLVAAPEPELDPHGFHSIAYGLWH